MTVQTGNHCEDGETREKLFSVIRDSIGEYGIGSSEEDLVPHYEKIAKNLFKIGIIPAKCQNYKIGLDQATNTLLGLIENKIFYEFRFIQDEASVVRRICIKREVIAGPKLASNDVPQTTCVNADGMDVRSMSPAAAQ